MGGEVKRVTAMGSAAACRAAWDGSEPLVLPPLSGHCSRVRGRRLGGYPAFRNQAEVGTV